MPRVKVIEMKLGREKALGEAEEGIIRIDPRQPASEYLDTLVHESLHLAFPEMSERKVNSSAHFIARILWAQGFRRCDL